MKVTLNDGAEFVDVRKSATMFTYFFILTCRVLPRLSRTVKV